MIIFCFILGVLLQIERHSLNVVDDDHIIEPSLQDQICHDFITPIIEVEKEYFLKSPKFPNHYPPNVDCIHIIKAPSSNMLIQLEFRETFDIEASKNCLHDFLQINDGPFLFSKMIARLCGTEIVQYTILSSNQYLWLRFYSDKTITKKGFKFNYKFVEHKNNKEAFKICYRKITIPNGHSALLTSQDIKRYQLTNDFNGIQECIFDIIVNGETNIFVYMAHLNSTGMLGLGQFIEIYDKNIREQTESKKHKNHIVINENYNFEKMFLKYPRIFVRIHFKNIQSIMTFQMVFTALIKKPRDNCSADEYPCLGSFCISKKLILNNYRNCPDGDDEQLFTVISIPNEEVSKTPPSVVEEKDQEQLHGLILGSITLVLICMLIGCIVHSVKQTRLNSEMCKTKGKDLVSLKIEKTPKDKLLKPSAASTITLNTDVLSKKVYNYSKPATTIKIQNSKDNELIFNYSTNNDFVETKESTPILFIPSKDSCPNYLELSKSLLSNNKKSANKSNEHLSDCSKFANISPGNNKKSRHKSTEHLSDCSKLANISPESVKNKPEGNFGYVIEEVTVKKPVRMKYYA